MDDIMVEDMCSPNKKLIITLLKKIKGNFTPKMRHSQQVEESIAQKEKRLEEKERMLNEREMQLNEREKKLKEREEKVKQLEQQQSQNSEERKQKVNEMLRTLRVQIPATVKRVEMIKINLPESKTELIERKEGQTIGEILDKVCAKHNLDANEYTFGLPIDLELSKVTEKELTLTKVDA